MRAANAQVDAEPGAAHLEIDGVPEPPNHFEDVFLKQVFRAVPGGQGLVDSSGFRELQESFQDAGTISFRVRARKIHIPWGERSEDLAAYTRAAEQHVQPPLSAVEIDRAEVHAPEVSSSLGGPIAYGDENDIALVALDVFDVFHEDVLGLAFAQESVQRGVLPASPFQYLGHHVGLRLGKGNDPQRQTGPFPRMLGHGVHDRLRLDLVGSRPAAAPASTGVDPIDRPELEPVVLVQLQGGGRQNQVVIVEFDVRHLDQRRIAGPVVPFQHPLA